MAAWLEPEPTHDIFEIRYIGCPECPMTAGRPDGSIVKMQCEAPVTVKQMYPIAAGLCEQLGQTFPSNRGEASDLIDKPRDEGSS
jgi:hypothetical protein